MPEDDSNQQDSQEDSQQSGNADPSTSEDNDPFGDAYYDEVRKEYKPQRS